MESKKEVLPLTKGAIEAHCSAALFHDYYRHFGYEKHEEARQAHIRKAKWFKAKGKKHSKGQGHRHSLLSNEDAFRVYNVTQAYLAKCRSSAEHANHMVAAHLDRAWRTTNHDEAQNHRQIALKGAPYSKWPSCGVEPF